MAAVTCSAASVHQFTEQCYQHAVQKEDRVTNCVYVESKQEIHAVYWNSAETLTRRQY
jgi:hypothetical protein